MTYRVAILGGYGNFGGYIARALANNPTIELIICGRNLNKAEAFAASLDGFNRASGAVVDIDDPQETLAAIAPDLVVHTVGPFQSQDYRVPKAALACGAHYCDLADARGFVAGIGALDEAAKTKGRAVIAGASSVPCLTAAYMDEASKELRIHRVEYGISAAQQTNRGLGTASAILSYVGQAFTQLRDGEMAQVHGWQGLRQIKYPQLGRRWFGYCDIPDLDIFPRRYPQLKDHTFVAGHEIASLHFGTWLLSWGVRLGVLPTLSRWSGFLLKSSFLFDFLGSDRSGFHMFIDGVDRHGNAVTQKYWLIARQGHGPNIPCMPAILIAKRLAAGEVIEPGARPCLDLITLDEYLGALGGLDIEAISE
ncbi:MAG: saccharopine dehydrogenase NADP-binding domain-containing protein [Erythrobacter sp.]